MGRTSSTCTFLSNAYSEDGIATGDINSAVVDASSIPAVPVPLRNLRLSDHASSMKFGLYDILHCFGTYEIPKPRITIVDSLRADYPRVESRCKKSIEVFNLALAPQSSASLSPTYTCFTS
jgi:hypothetical protein